MLEARDIIAKTRRFAHLIVSSAREADQVVFDVVDAEKTQLMTGMGGEDMRTMMYQSLCDKLSTHTVTEPDGREDVSVEPVINRFRNLPLMHRMAFALMVIEELPSQTAAQILRVPDEMLEEKIGQSRRMMFEE